MQQIPNSDKHLIPIIRAPFIQEFPQQNEQIVEGEILQDEPMPNTNRGNSFAWKEASAIAFAFGFMVAWGIGLLVNGNKITLNGNAMLFSMLASLALGNIFGVWSVHYDLSAQWQYLKLRFKISKNYK